MEVKNDKFSYEIDDKYPSKVFDERGNKSLQLTKIKWNGKGDFKLQIRNFFSTDGGEQVGSGVAFLTEDGPNELINALLENGHGDPDEIVQICMEKRPEICGAFLNGFDNLTEQQGQKAIMIFRDTYETLNDDKDSDDEYYDPEELI